LRDVRFTPESGHSAAQLERPLCAKLRHSAVQHFAVRCSKPLTGDTALSACCTKQTSDDSRSGDFRMNISIPIILAISLTPAEVECSELVLRTAFGGVFCATPFQLRKAITAASADDGARIRQLSCLRTKSGIEAVWIDQIALPYGPWQVRLLLKHAPSITVWGYASSFESGSEEEVPR
jgi:hypothetical protein